MKKPILVLSMFSLTLGVVACTPKDAPKTQSEQSSTTTQPETQTAATKPEQKTEPEQIPAVWAKSYRMNTVNQEVCHEASEDDQAACTIYDVQSIKTNLEWINTYYDEQLKEQYPEAFSEKSTLKLEGEDANRKYYAGSMISFQGQKYNLVTFYKLNNIYLGGAHNMFNTEYDVWDLKTKKKLKLDDVIQKNARAKLLTLIKKHNESELKEYGTDLNELKLSENFYFGDYGIVFVYAPYEIAPFVYGMPELTIPYEDLQTLIKTDYLPSRPDQRLSQGFS